MRAMTFAAAERRKASRYRLRLPVLFSWIQGEQFHTEGGFTRDVSAKGLFVTSRVAPPSEAPIRLEVVLPLLAEMSQNAMRATGRVVRTFSASQPQGFAIAAEFCGDETDHTIVENPVLQGVS
ncbi:MAG: PilZ domain-containing protein [Acidobacteria bacterium]|nr:PilZ domain-containing protein [Acidobacteriota bacterium]